MLTACILSLVVYHVGATSIVINSMKACNNASIIQITSKTQVKNGLQEYDFTFDLGDTLGNNNNIKALVARDYGKQIKHLITLERKGFCKGLREFLGIVITEVLTAMNHPHPTQCPIEKGTWRMNWHHVDVGKVPGGKFIPPGKFLITIYLTDVSNKELACILVAVEKK